MEDDLYEMLEDFRGSLGTQTAVALGELLLATRYAASQVFPIGNKANATKEGRQSDASGFAVAMQASGLVGAKQAGRDHEQDGDSAGDCTSDYFRLLDDAFAQGLLGDASDAGRELKLVEEYWVDQINDFSNPQPIAFPLDPAQSVGQNVTTVLDAVTKRQSERGGEKTVLTVLQHMVGAALELALPNAGIVHHSAATSDDQGGRAGDFLIGDCVIHVTAAPSERLIAKCIANLSANLRPIVVCPYHRIGLARGLAETAGVSARVEVYDAQSFISMNLNEVANFSCASLSVTTARFVDRYNALIEAHEGDPSLLLKAK